MPIRPGAINRVDLFQANLYFKINAFELIKPTIFDICFDQNPAYC